MKTLSGGVRTFAPTRLRTFLLSGGNSPKEPFGPDSKHVVFFRASKEGELYVCSLFVKSNADHVSSIEQIL